MPVTEEAAMQITDATVLESAEWVFDEYRDELIGDVDSSDVDYEPMREAAMQLVAFGLFLHWMPQGYRVRLVSSSEFSRMTWCDEAVNETKSSYLLPDPEESLTLWKSVVDAISIDEVRQSAGLS